jgi:formiminoglutamase
VPVELVRGNGPLLVTLPHTGLSMPRMIVDRLNDPTGSFTAPDRFLSRLLANPSHQTSTLAANFHRYVSDVDYLASTRQSEDRDRMVGMVPLRDASGAPIWDQPPGLKEASRWRAMYYAPYHAALAAQLARMRAQFGHVVILNLRARHDLHSDSMKARKVGLANGYNTSCATDLSIKLINLLQSYDEFEAVANHDIRQGHTTRHYGRPAACFHAVDLEISEACYLAAADDDVVFDNQKADPVRHLLNDVIALINAWQPG